MGCGKFSPDGNIHENMWDGCFGHIIHENIMASGCSISVHERCGDHIATLYIRVGLTTMLNNNILVFPGTVHGDIVTLARIELYIVE